MKRFNCPHSMASLLYPPQEKKTRNSKYVYDQAFQTMLDDLDDEEEEEIDQHTEKKRRLCPGQVEALEKNFEVDNRLEPEKKTKLAQELGLKPRQIAIWFQNRRARWKGKQLEKDYNVLKSNYEALKINFDKLEKDNECLAKELIGLKEKLLKENRESNEAEALFWGSNVYFCESLDSREILTQFGEGEDQSCNIFSLDQAPTLHW